MKEYKVVCGIIYKKDKIFIARRKEGKSMVGKWEFPGGKIEVGETEIVALKRELEEELGMAVDIIEALGNNVHHYPTFSIELIAYKCTFLSASFELTDHDAYEWVAINEVLQYNLTEADIPLVKLII